MADDIRHDPLLLPEYDDGEIVGVLPDGSGYLVQLPGPGRAAYVTRTADDIVGWRCRCTCGRWSSDPFRRVLRAAEEDLAERRVFAGRDATAVPQRPDVLAAAAVVWDREHLAVLRALAAVASAHGAVDVALSALDDAVTQARFAGATWDAIGSAAGMTRQSAHARWSDRGRQERHR